MFAQSPNRVRISGSLEVHEGDEVTIHPYANAAFNARSAFGPET